MPHRSKCKWQWLWATDELFTGQGTTALYGFSQTPLENKTRLQAPQHLIAQRSWSSIETAHFTIVVCLRAASANMALLSCKRLCSREWSGLFWIVSASFWLSGLGELGGSLNWNAQHKLCCTSKSSSSSALSDGCHNASVKSTTTKKGLFHPMKLDSNQAFNRGNILLWRFGPTK